MGWKVGGRRKETDKAYIEDSDIDEGWSQTGEEREEDIIDAVRKDRWREIKGM